MRKNATAAARVPQACHEGAIGMVNGKAKLLRDDYCDGLGDCLPACPTGAITFVEREAAAYDEAAVHRNEPQNRRQAAPLLRGCPGTQARAFQPGRQPLPPRGGRRQCPPACASGRCRSSWCR